jgi:chromosome segregation protein
MSLTLKRLEMHGFKSFAKRTVLEFNAPVTAIVGPNGSGKSNVVEAIRFVLGEQSSKSLRSKSGADLIFKGSRLTPKMNRASITIVFDNTNRMFQLPNLALDFDEVSISREVFPDGTNTYSINGSEVRMRDIHELIASVHIGSSGHHIISQGEADRLLNAKPAERREILEEALGLRLYHYRINESTKKLEKTREHIKEIESLRRELAPHIKFLKKQVERVEQAESMRTELGELYRTYLVSEESIVTRDMNRLNLELATLQEKMKTATGALQQLSVSVDDNGISHLQSRLQEFHVRKKILEQSESEIARTLGRIEGTLQALSRSIAQPSSDSKITIDQKLVQELISSLDTDIGKALLATDISGIHTILRSLQERLQSFKNHLSEPKKDNQGNSDDEIAKLGSDQKELEQQLSGIQNELTILQQEILNIESDISKSQELLRTSDKSRYEQETIIRELAHQEQLVMRDRATMSDRFEALELEYRVATELIGESIMGLRGSGSFDPDLFSHTEHQSRKSSIDRLKVRLEDMGGGGAGDILKEYDETTTRDEYLGKQLQDLTDSMADLEKIITELKESLTGEFHKGIKQINSVFEKFFVTMFGGGSAKLDVIEIIPKRRKSSDEDEDEIIDEDAVREQGIDIDVNLPRKKVKDLEMLSGGERSLTSIALLFALSQVNPPPFLVLDETDAALDEANSKKYGDMIETLAIETQLIVVTHNRETMSRASILYGVTLGADDSSTLLSIKFEEAVKVAK